jgi:dTDP-4-dehydrorhamnose 3,5-epimerase
MTMMAIPEVRLLVPRRFEDARGFLSETYSRQRLAEAGIGDALVQENHSYSAVRGTVRGLHFQAPPFAQAKLVRVLRGAVFDVAVDIRRGSPTYGRHVAAVLSRDNWTQLYVPAGFAHGFCTLEPDTEVLYKLDAAYAPQAEGGLAWDDPDLGIDWPVATADAVLSDKDRVYPRLKDLDSPFVHEESHVG